MIPQQHANFIVNLGGASSADVLSIIRQIRQTVYQRANHWLACEVRYVAPDGRQMPAHEACGN